MSGMWEWIVDFGKKESDIVVLGLKQGVTEMH